MAVLRTVLQLLSPAQTGHQPEGTLLAKSLRNDSEDIVEAIAASVARLDDPRQAVLVLDDFPDLDSVGVDHVVSLGRRLGVLGARVLLTTRRVALGSLATLHEAQIVDGDDLRLTKSEAADVATAVTGLTAKETDVAAIHEACTGHPAAFSVLLRHADLGSDGWVPKRSPSLDLRSRLTYLAETELPNDGRLALHVMALLGKGDLRDLRSCGLDVTSGQLDQLGTVMPLVRTGRSTAQSAADEFIVHDLAQEVFSSEEFYSGSGGAGKTIWAEVVRTLVARGDTVRAALLVENRGDEQEVSDWLLVNGYRLLREGGSHCLARMLHRLPVSRFVQTPALLLVHARMLQERSQFDEAIEKANVARAICEHERDEFLAAESMLVAGECYLDTGKYDEALAVLSGLVARPNTGLTTDQKAWALAAMAGCSMYLGKSEDALALASNAASIAKGQDSSPSIRAYVLGTAGAIAALVRGDLAESLSHFSLASEVDQVPRALQAKAQGNRGVSLCEMGRLERCVEAIDLTLHTCLEADRGVYRGAFLPVLGAALVGLGSTEAGMGRQLEGIGLSLASGDRYGASYNRIYLSTALRAADRAEESLSEAEQALEFFSGLDASSQCELATLELAASLLALDDVSAATRTVEAVRAGMSGLNAYHLLRADMILAEAERRLGRVDKAVARLMNHEEYILTESSNWQIAMYCRAFPELLGLFALAIDTERLPAHLVRMVLPENAERALAVAKGLLEPNVWRRLGQRLLGEEGFEEYLSRDGRPLCRVRLFGGLEVNVGGRIVSEREWRKRKARLLFAMLVIRRGQDVPRDQVLEHLWPEMDEARAKNNLYVIWSAMKSALSPEADKNEPCPYIDNTGGVCRVVADSVRSDVEEFEQTLSKAREAQTDGKVVESLRLYERLAEIYRGELLPGDVYDDWFVQVRDEFRAKYADAMLQAASMLQRDDDPLGALTFVRRALNQDPWREDLYQAALTCQIAAGQRSAAIETYLQCRSKLSEDLGLDPSVETRALYDQILAMEERPAPRRSILDD